MVKEVIKEQKGIEYYMQLPYSILLHEIEDEGEKYWIAEVPELPGCKSHGSTINEAVSNVEEAKKDWVLDSLEEGDEIPIPIERDRFSGKTLVRMSRSLHRALSLMAESEKLSLNQLIVTMLAKEVGRLGVLNRVEDKLDKVLDRLSDLVETSETKTLSARNIYNLLAEGREYNEFEVPIDDRPFLRSPGLLVTNATDDIDYIQSAMRSALKEAAWLSGRAPVFSWIIRSAEKETKPENKCESKVE